MDYSITHEKIHKWCNVNSHTWINPHIQPVNISHSNYREISKRKSSICQTREVSYESLIIEKKVYIHAS